jgi:hypothetical protein
LAGGYLNLRIGVDELQTSLPSLERRVESKIEKRED